MRSTAAADDACFEIIGFLAAAALPPSFVRTPSPTPLTVPSRSLRRSHRCVLDAIPSSITASFAAPPPFAAQLRRASSRPDFLNRNDKKMAAGGSPAALILLSVHFPVRWN